MPFCTCPAGNVLLVGDYAASGVDEEREQSAFAAVMRPWLEKTRVARAGVRVTSGIGSGHFASVLSLGDGLPSVAITTDGVGTKIEVARLAGRFETVGIDCVANNVNDLICVGADPVALVDYIALDKVDERVLGELARGLFLGADAAGIAVVGGEIAQVASMLAARAEGAPPVFDLVGTAVGVLAAGATVLDGSAAVPGDVVVGVRSSGLHSNGYSLARRALGDGVLGLADALLEPTRVYVGAARALWQAGVEIHGMVHISGGGLLNVLRLAAGVAYVLDGLPEPPAVFEAVRAAGDVPLAEMYATFNMGVGLCVVVPPAMADATVAAVSDSGEEASVIGRVVDGPDRRVEIPSAGLVGRGDAFA
ncbi:MAG TPA: phosphoribosylformylglycinamidine cyclo-ligase [Acidimicrobiales bacterium]|nr:phosphoribosylformylglycinamidine cyclo-ligase [Acidimicrobiales bacterium]